MITAEQSKALERQQTQALKNVFGPNISARKLRQMSGLKRLAERREELSLNFAKKCLINQTTRHWFCERRNPVYSRRPGVSYPRYVEKMSRTDRYRNSPKNYLVRLLNASV